MCKTIHQKVKIKASPETIYELLVNATQLRALTGKRATNTEKIGGAFSSLNGAITGINVDLAPGKRIVQAWRDREFPIGIFSMATILLKEAPSGDTEIKLIHRGVPKELIPRIERQWRALYWEKMKIQYGQRRSLV